MKKIFYLLLCAVTVTLFSCDKIDEPKSQDPDQKQEEEQKQEEDLFDPNGEAQMRVSFLVTDTMLNFYKTMALYDSLDNYIDWSDRQVRPVDTLNTEDKYLCMNMSFLPSSRYFVIEYNITVKVGEHDFRIRWERNNRPLPGVEQDLGVAGTIAAFTDDAKVTLDKRISARGVQFKDIRMDADPAESEARMEKTMKSMFNFTHLYFSFQKYK